MLDLLKSASHFCFKGEAIGDHAICDVRQLLEMGDANKWLVSFVIVANRKSLSRISGY